MPWPPRGRCGGLDANHFFFWGGRCRPPSSALPFPSPSAPSRATLPFFAPCPPRARHHGLRRPCRDARPPWAVQCRVFAGSAKRSACKRRRACVHARGSRGASRGHGSPSSCRAPLLTTRNLPSRLEMKTTQRLGHYSSHKPHSRTRSLAMVQGGPLLRRRLFRLRYQSFHHWNCGANFAPCNAGPSRETWILPPFEEESPTSQSPVSVLRSSLA
eukprot:355767-Chlamydomonas_euryale.AAC.7